MDVAGMVQADVDEAASKAYRDLLDWTVPLTDVRATYAALGDAK